MISKCNTCAKVRQDQKEPLLSSSFPSRPWERLGMDLFDFQGKIYLLVVDYYSRWLEIKRLHSQTSDYVMNILKELFATHGIPEIVISDNGPQYASEAFRKFAKTYGFIHSTSSPRYPQANGEAERAVRTAKEILKKNQDPYLALLSYHSTPLQNGLSPSQLLMGRQLKTQLPVLPATLKPKDLTFELERVVSKEKSYRRAQETNFNRRHRARELPTFDSVDAVWVKDQSKQGEILSSTQYPRSYLVKTDKGILRRNRSALVSITEGSQETEPTRPEQTVDPPTTQQPVSPRTPPIVPPAAPTSGAQSTQYTTTRSGRVVRPPQRLDL